MKYAVYGLPCAGKDYLISQLLQQFAIQHIRGSDFLNANSGGRFRELPAHEQEKLRKAFISYIDSFRNNDVIVDGHYCFIENGEYNVVFTEDDGDCYDVFFYLSTPASTIRERILSSDKNKKFAHLTDEQINAWKEHEIKYLQKECFEREKEFIILNGDNASNLEFISKVVTKNIPKSVSIANDIVHLILPECTDKDVCLVDCDKTVSNNDATDFIFVGNQQDKRKDLFSGDCYTPYQVYSMNKEYESILHLDSKIDDSVEKTEINTELVSDLEQLKKTLFVGLTCGLSDIWTDLSKKYGFPNMIFGNNIRNKNLITAAVKGYVAKYLRQNGKKVVGVGDSVADFYMLLNSDVGYVIAHNKINKSLQNLLLETKISTIKQPKSNRVLFEKVPVVGCIHEDIN